MVLKACSLVLCSGVTPGEDPIPNGMPGIEPEFGFMQGKFCFHITITQPLPKPLICFCVGPTPNNAQNLFLARHPEITPGSAQGSICCIQICLCTIYLSRSYKLRGFICLYLVCLHFGIWGALLKRLFLVLSSGLTPSWLGTDPLRCQNKTWVGHMQAKGPPHYAIMLTLNPALQLS